MAVRQVTATTSSTSAGIDQEAILAGDRAEFEKLVRQESPRLFHVLRRYVRDEDDARSVMQETFLQAYKRLATFRGDSKLTTWLYGIGINQARAFVRKQSRVDMLEEADIERLQPNFRMGMYRGEYAPARPDALAVREERRSIVHDAIGRLSEDYRIVVELRDIQEFSTAEVAEMLGMTRGAVRVRLHRARQALRALLEPYIEAQS